MSMPIKLATKRAVTTLNAVSRRNVSFASATAKASHLPSELKDEILVSSVPQPSPVPL